LLAVVLVGAVFVAAVGALPNVGYVGFLSVDQQQLRNLALDVLNTMLLDAGYPLNWGSIQAFSNSTVQRFGLALDDSSSFYALDPDKVSRLVAGYPAGHLGYETIRDRLRLQGYGFIFRIIPPFNVTINNNDPSITLANIISGVEVLVRYHDGSPIPNANVEATILYAKGKNDEDIYLKKTSSRTDAVGKCVIRDPTLPSDVSYFVIVFKVTVADLATITSSYTQGLNQDVLSASIVGDNVTLQIPRKAMPGDNNNTSGERWVEQITSVDENGVWNFYDGSHKDDPINYGQGSDKYIWSRVFSGLNYDTPMFLIFTINVPLKKEQGESKPGRQLVLFLGPRPNWMGIRVQAYGDSTGVRGATSAVKIQRNVIISGMTYIAEFIIWKQ
jgi:hypothetical protein